MIKFNSIHIENFLSLGVVDLNLNDNSGFILVDGENHRVEDAAASNGSGKTSAFEAIIWALTGETNRGYKDVVNCYQDDNCKVKLTFDFKDHSWIIERSRNKKGSQDLHIWKDSHELEYKGLRDAESVLTKELPELTLNFLGSTIILGQGLPQRFTNNTPAGRKAVLEELSNADYMISHIKENIKHRQDKLSSDLRDVEDSILVQLTKLGVAKKTRENAELSLELLRQINISDKKLELDKLVEEGKKTKLDYEKAQAEVSAAEENYIKVSQDLSKLESAFTEHKSKLEKERLEKLSIIQKDYSNRLLHETEELGPKIESVKRDLYEIKESVAHKQAIISGGYCKLCGQKLQSVSEKDIEEARDFIEKSKFKSSELEEKLEYLETKKQQINEEFKQAEISEKMCVDQSFDMQIDLLQKEFKANFQSLQESIQTAQISLKDTKFLATEINNKLLNFRSTYQLKKSEIDSYEINLKTREETLQKAIQEIKDCENFIDTFQVKKLDFENRLKVVKSFDTFASRDFRGILLEDIVNQLDCNLHKYAKKVYGEPLTRFYQEGNAIGIQFDGKEYESLSGGEKQKLDVLIQLSLRDLIIQTSGIEANLVVFDEIFDALDQTGCEALLNVIMDLGLTVYSITHRKELNIPYDKRYVIVKESNGIAHLEIG